MKKSAVIIFLAVFLLANTSFGAMPGHDHKSKGTESDHTMHVGDLIHESTVEGHRLTYHLIVLPTGEKGHHLVLYIADPDGKPVEKAKAGFLVEGPDDSKQKVMAMSMSPGFGGDVNFKAKGTYTIKTKIEMSDGSLIDSFTYTIE